MRGVLGASDGSSTTQCRAVEPAGERSIPFTEKPPAEISILAWSTLAAFEWFQRETYACDDIVPSLFLAGRVLEIKTMNSARSR